MTPVPLLQHPLLDALPNVAHGFTSREGGVAQSVVGPLTLAPHAALTAGELAENWARVSAAFGVPPSCVALVQQVHGRQVRRVEAQDPLGADRVLGEADAMWTTDPGLLLAVRVADCVPILLAGPGVVAAIHSGWRGTAVDIAGDTVRAVAEGAGVSPSALRAVIGPCISGAAYEVSEDVVAALEQTGLGRDDVLWPTDGERPHVDLGAAVAVQLGRAGVTQVARIGACSFSDPSLHSHRRDGATSGRMAGLVMLCGG